jgi:hypothetical protein
MATFQSPCAWFSKNVHDALRALFYVILFIGGWVLIGLGINYCVNINPNVPLGGAIAMIVIGAVLGVIQCCCCVHWLVYEVSCGPH